MDMSGVEKDLQRRINQSREWLELDNSAPILGIKKIRNYPCEAKPVMFIDDPKRKERYGVRFRLEFITDQGAYESFVDVRIRDNRSMSKDGKSIASAPYIASYAVDSETGQHDLITHEEIVNTRIYKNSLNLSINEWYQDWLLKALWHKKVSKIFHVKKQIKSKSE